MKSNIQKISIVSTLGLILSVSSVSADEMKLSTSADFLASMNIIEMQSEEAMYNLESNITRREMLKIMMNISGQDIPNTCNGDFSDLHSDDWGCKYAEAALRAGFIANNDMFRPNDTVTEIESLKMVMQARGIERDENADWRKGYESKAMSAGVIDSDLNYDASANRNMVFDIAAKTYEDFVSMMHDDKKVVDEIMEEEGVMVGGAMMVASRNIVENAVEADNVTTLVAAVQAADLVEALSAEGPFTVFAPTNDAFAALPDGTVDTLLMAENKGQLTDILTYHVVSGAYLASDITDGLELRTLNGQTLIFTIDADGMVSINGQTMVETANVISSNGITHVIDTVLMPSE